MGGAEHGLPVGNAIDSESHAPGFHEQVRYLQPGRGGEAEIEFVFFGILRHAGDILPHDIAQEYQSRGL